MAAIERESGSGKSHVRVDVAGTGESNVATGLSVLDNLLALLATYASFNLSLELAPGDADAEVAAAGRTLGEALTAPLWADGARGHGSAVGLADEALAQVVLEVSGRPLVVSNVDLSDARIGGLGSDVLARFLDEFAEGAGLTLHVRLIEGAEADHVLAAIFKALGVALAQACQARSGKER